MTNLHLPNGMNTQGHPADPVASPETASAIALVKIASIVQRIEMAIVGMTHEAVSGDEMPNDVEQQVQPAPQHWAAFLGANIGSLERIASYMQIEATHVAQMMASEADTAEEMAGEEPSVEDGEITEATE